MWCEFGAGVEVGSVVELEVDFMRESRLRSRAGLKRKLR